VVVRFSARPAVPGVSDLKEGGVAEVRFEITDEATGQPVRGQVPAAWMDLAEIIQARGEGPHVRTCRDKIALYLKGVVGIRPLVDLNSYSMVVLTKEPSLTIIDPNVSMAGSTSTLAQIVLKQPGMDWSQDALRKQLYVSMPLAGQVAVVDTESWKVKANVAAGAAPARVALQPDGKVLWAASDAAKGDGVVTAIDGDTLKPVASVPVGAGHHEIVVSDDNRFVFVSNRDSGTVSVIDARTRQKLRDLKTGPLPIALAWSAQSHALYVSDGRDGRIAVVDAAGEAVTRFQVRQGFVAFGLTGASPTLAAPVELTLLAQAPGYLSTGQDLTLLTDKSPPAVIRMVKTTAPPTGAVGTTGQAIPASATGVVLASATLSTPAEPNTGAGATLTVPQGTVARDPSGAALGGPLTADLLYFNNQDESSLLAFPGGFDVRANIANRTGRMGLISGGYSSVEIKDPTGKPVKSFSNPVQLDIGVPKATVNPVTGKAVAVGDTIPYWSFEPTTGAWSYEGKATLQAGSGGNLLGRLAVTHFSYYNLDWYYLAETCTSGRYNVTGRPEGWTYLVIDLIYAANGQLYKRMTASIEDGFVGFIQAPANVPMRVIARNPYTMEVMAQVQVSSLCAGGTLALTAPAPTLTATANVRGLCSNGIELRPSSAVYFRNVTRNGAWVFIGYMTDGRGTATGLVSGDTYEFLTYVLLRDGFYRATRTHRPGVDPPTIDLTINLPDRIC
jgi:YVTN family beta-propeller protein